MKQVICPHCKGKVEVPELSNTVVCPYCSTTIQIPTGEISKEHYIMRTQFTLQQSRDRLFSWVVKQLGAPKGLDQKANIRDHRLVYWPFWVVGIKASSDYTGNQWKPDFSGSHSEKTSRTKIFLKSGHIDTHRDVFVPAHPGIPKHLRRFVIPTRRKEFFKRELVLDSGGFQEAVHVDRDKAVELAKGEVKEALLKEALKDVGVVNRIDYDVNVSAVFLVHVPVWHLRYSYSLKSYEALVDAASGRVIFSRFPMKLAYRASLIMNGVVQLVVGGGIGLAVLLVGLFVLPASIYAVAVDLFGLALGLGMLAFAMRYFITAFSLKSGVETAG